MQLDLLVAAHIGHSTWSVGAGQQSLLPAWFGNLIKDIQHNHKVCMVHKKNTNNKHKKGKKKTLPSLLDLLCLLWLLKTDLVIFHNLA